MLIIKDDFSVSDNLCFLLPLLPISMLLRPQNLSDNLTYSTLERGRGDLNRIQCNFIENEGKSTETIAHFARDCRNVFFTLSEKNEVHIGISFNNFIQLLLNLRIMWGTGLPIAVSVEHVTVSLAVTCALYNGKIWEYG